MKPEKMTDDEAKAFMAAARGDVACDEDAVRQWLARGASHIAALTAERDEKDGLWGDALKRFEAAARDAAALRERVQTLEVECERLRKLWNHDADAKIHAQNVATALGWRLAAIRQRAVDVDTIAKVGETCAIMGSLGTGWDEAIHADVMARDAVQMLRDAARGVARYVVGEDDTRAERIPDYDVDAEADRQAVRDMERERQYPGCTCTDFPREVGDACPKHIGAHSQVSELDGLEGEMGSLCEPSTVKCGHKLGTNSEPTTAEAFAALRRGRQLWAESAADAPAGVEARRDLVLLSLLERRTVAVVLAAREAVQVLHSIGQTKADEPLTGDQCAEMTRVKALLHYAVTDAPPVFTLEEVEKAMRTSETNKASWDYGIEDRMRDVKSILYALRK